MTVRELRQKYIEFFQSKGHQRHPSGSLVPYDVTGKLDESLLFNGAGMVQFKPYFRGVAKPPHPRLTNSQKCVRTGDIESVGDLTHLTFFEMLGNFSFGDYFKKEAIDLSWEFMTSPQWLGLDPRRLSFTVFEDDDVAFEAWSAHLLPLGIDPASRVFRLGEETNYWPAGAFSSGPPGPCGPNSEMFYWTPSTPPPGTGPGEYSRERYLEDEDKWLEIWNDVFIQFEWKGRLRDPNRPGDGYVKEGMDPLPFQSIDTGMGLERTAVALGGYASVYDTDAFSPILARIESLRRSAAVSAQPPVGQGQDALDTHGLEARATEGRATRIIADHIRTACFCIADGVLPSNTGRGYVLRRLIRRAVLKGQRVLGFNEPFFHLVYDAVRDSMDGFYPELVERADVIRETLLNEERLFRRTLVEGYERLIDVLRRFSAGAYTETLNDPDNMAKESRRILRQIQSPEDFRAFWGGKPSRVVWSQITEPVDDLPREEWLFPGAIAFKLYDTYGFPLEVTQELCAEAGVEVDLEGYEKALKEAQERSRGSSDMDTVYGGQQEALLLSVSSEATPQTTFVGYDRVEHVSELSQISPRFDADGRTTGEFQIVLNETPFYAESGGQVGDTGVIESDEFRFRVTGTWKEAGLIWHDATLESLQSPLFPLPSPPPSETREGAPLAGLTLEQIRSVLDGGLFFGEVTARVDADRRRKITRNHTATHLLHAALRQTLGKHVTQAGSLVSPDHLRFDFTHGKAMTPEEIARVEAIVNEEALRGLTVQIHSDLPIEEAKRRGAMALFGEKYGDRVRMVQVGDFSMELCGGCHIRTSSEVGLFKIIGESSAASGVRRIEAVTGEGAYEWVTEQTRIVNEVAKKLRTHPQELSHAVDRTLETLREERKRAERMRTQAADKQEAPTVDVGGVELARQKLGEGDMKDATLLADRLVEGQPTRVAVVALVSEGKATIICKVGAEALAKGAHAGNLVRELAKIAGGGGGGKPDFATAGARDLSKLDDALSAASEILAQQLGVGNTPR